MSSETRYDVVINHEEQHSIRLSGQDIPAGWRAAGFRGSEEERLTHIASAWTDTRPLSLRQRSAQVS